MIRIPISCLLAATLAGWSAAPAPAAERAVPRSQAEITLSYAPLVKKTAPAVVNIYTRRVVQTQRSPFFNDPFFRQFFGDNLPTAPRERIQNSLGSGVIVRADGIVVTSNHVIEKADQITVVLSDRRELPAEVVLTDARTDIAVLRIDAGGKKLPYLKLRSTDDLEVGDLVLAIGNPFGVGQTVTGGIVSALARAAAGVSDFSFFIQTDAAINPGNSGGALVTMDGRLAGINTAIYSRSGGSQGIGFAIPADMVRAVLAGALNDARIVRPWFGGAGQELTADVARSIGLDRPGGVIVTEIHRGGPAARAGLRVGDVIAAINGREVADPNALRFRIATLPVGEAAALSVLRQGRALSLALPLEAPPETPPRDATELAGRNPFAGATVANLSPALADELSLDPMQRGVIVMKVDRRAPAGRIGIRPGDVVVSINGAEIATVDSLEAVLRRPADRWTISVRRDGRMLSVVIEG
ncbi:MAG: Do family serine endopeptidase [Alphaproteobacteria bacterium]|nr:Do family serine endopeptidase [Alphaproteobacteria bacterium]